MNAPQRSPSRRRGPGAAPTAPSAAGERDAHRAAVFLDKDGTLLVDVPYNVDPARCCAHAGRRRRRSRVSTRRHAAGGGQQPAGHRRRGLHARRDIARLRARARLALLATAGVHAGRLLFLPARAGRPGSAPDRLRLPQARARHAAAGAAQAHGTSTSRRSWMIGDILDDVEAGPARGLPQRSCSTSATRPSGGSSPLREPAHRAPELPMPRTASSPGSRRGAPGRATSGRSSQ